MGKQEQTTNEKVVEAGEKGQVEKGQAEKGQAEKVSFIAISYCPHQRTYLHRLMVGGVVLFDEVSLVAKLDGLLKVGKATEADYYASLTGMARLHPHKEVVIFANGRVALLELPVEPEGEESGDRGRG